MPADTPTDHEFVQWAEKPDYKWCMAMVPDGPGFQRICRRTREAHSLSAHTPGPWAVVPEVFRGGIYCEPTVDAGSYEDGEPRTVATIRVGLAGTEANARLIAAAPELLAALRSILLVEECAIRHKTPPECPGCSAVRAAKAAIAKAESGR